MHNNGTRADEPEGGVILTPPGAGRRRPRRRAGHGRWWSHPAPAPGTGPTDDDRPGRLPEQERDDIPDFDHARAEARCASCWPPWARTPTARELRETPARVARAYAELTSGIRMTPEDVLTTTFDLGHDEMVLVKDIELWSMCEHHLVPFTGVAHVGYIPAESGKITGLSKLARLVDVYAKRPQVQERLMPGR